MIKQKSLNVAIASILFVGGSSILMTNTVFAHDINNNQPINYQIQDRYSSQSNDLNIISENGFDITDVVIASYENSTITYQNGIPWFNPGGNIYSVNSLFGIESNGTKVKLTDGQVVGSSLTGDKMRYTYKLSDVEKKKFVSYMVDVQFKDTLWNQKGSAQATFTLPK